MEQRVAALKREIAMLRAGLLLLVGISLAAILVLVLWLGSPVNKFGDSGQEHNGSEQTGQEKGNNSEPGSFWHWDGWLVSSSDTAAQWVMTIFTIVAAGLLWRTLITTRNMVADTRDIGRKQSRAYLHMSLSKIEAKGITGKEDVNIRLDAHFTIANSGLTPAYDVRILYDICETLKGTGAEIEAENLQDAGFSASFISSGEASNQRLSRVWRTAHPDLFKPTGLHCIRISYIITFMDEFGDSRETPITSGTLHEFPKGNLAFLPDRVEFRDTQ